MASSGEDRFRQALASFHSGRLNDAERYFKKVLRQQPKHIGALNILSVVLTRLEKYSEAEHYVLSALKANSNSDATFYNYALVLKALKRPNEALEAFNRAILINANIAETWNNRGTVFNDLKRYGDAVGDFNKAISLRPNYFEAYYNQGKSLAELKRYDEALAAYGNALTIKPDLEGAWLGRGNVFSDLKRYDEALAAYDKALTVKPDLEGAWLGRGNAFSELKRYDDAIAAYDKAFALKPGRHGTEGARLQAKMCLCDWSNFNTECKNLISSVRNGHFTAPFSFFAINSSSDDQLQCAKLWVEEKCPPSQEPLWQDDWYSHDRIRIAYVSTDFREHPVAYLASGIFECHNRSQFEIIGFSIGPNDNSEMRRRLEGSFDRFIDAAAFDSDQIAKKIKEAEIDILIDLNGFTHDARTEIFARRPAPVQVNYLGYAGTMGASYIDYIIADPTLIPTSRRSSYLEKIIYLPHCYMPHDDKSRLISDCSQERHDFGLPEKGFVFCCFNNAYKIKPHNFRLWMKLLKAVEGSILWLSETNAIAVNNLRNEAIVSGVDAERLVFAKHLPSSADHLARHRLADLFLDTLPYNAHTTASDALWAGLPVVTLIGETFAGRVAASLLNAIGLPELITTTPEAYEHLAIDLATNPEKLANIKLKLSANRLVAPLFDTKLYTKHIEAAYVAVYERHQSRLAPDYIVVPS